MGALWGYVEEIDLGEEKDLCAVCHEVIEGRAIVWGKPWAGHSRTISTHVDCDPNPNLTWA